MRIGELSQRTQVSVRMLRYYEQQGLLAPGRERNGYRSYTEDDVERATLVSSLIRSGLPTRLIGVLLERSRSVDVGADTEVRALLGEEAERLERRIACLTLSRDAVRDYLRRANGRTLLRTPAGSPPSSG
ncbi:MerR family transcriptional regulator [Nocardioides sp. zg-1228]|uniref:MerR family transcriptional regulator n=1 Tax=Nocardioides sp. zg-1228 TaxID=2763008 RepID=UPI0016426504|nr:MerR family transcriptional regulator [Nocardioides sp. zg-1228]MBC2934647.1 MerR family transcriptional regulator [Nocardioides sp. zg-1228]QSF55968.1 MerR family transcriptional regulator [Nocardioides sp. zg-1228]